MKFKKVCEYCKNEFETKRDARKFCSSKCCTNNNKGRKWPKEVKDKISKGHLGKTVSEKTKNKISKTRKERLDLGIIQTWNKGLTISDPRVKNNSEKATVTIRKQFQEGRKPHNWNGGPKNWKKFVYKNHNNWIIISKLFKQIFPNCSICGNIGEHVHHKDFTTINHNASNLQTLCRVCHKRIHAQHKIAIENY